MVVGSIDATNLWLPLILFGEARGSALIRAAVER